MLQHQEWQACTTVLTAGLSTEERESALMSLIIEILLKSLYQSREQLNSQFKAHISFKCLIILAMPLF